MCFDFRIRVDGVPGGFWGMACIPGVFLEWLLGWCICYMRWAYMEHLEFVLVYLIFSSQKYEELR